MIYFDWTCLASNCNGGLTGGLVGGLFCNGVLFASGLFRVEHYFDFVKRSLKASWVPIYNTIPSIIFNSDILVFTTITGSVMGVAFYSAAKTISYLILNADSISNALYAKILSGGSQEYLKENLYRFSNKFCNSM